MQTAEYNEHQRPTAFKQTKDATLLDVFPITGQNIDDILPMFTKFRQVAVSDYGFPSAAIDNDTLKLVFEKGFLSGYLLREFPEDRVVGFMLYQVESFRALEVKVIYLESQISTKLGLQTLMDRLLADAKGWDGWDVMSYALLGAKQQEYIHYLTWAGFTPVGQAVVKFNIYDGITLEVFQRVKLTPLPEGYKIVSWEPQYEEGVIEVLADAFEKSVDALWDPRFRSRDGVRKSLAFLKSGAYGTFYPPSVKIMLNEKGEAVGVSLLNIVSAQEANIPLIGLKKSERGKKLAKTLLFYCVDSCLGEILKDKLAVTHVSATVATENLPAVRMYRHTGFQEDHWYTHMYQDREKVLARRPGQWC